MKYLFLFLCVYLTSCSRESEVIPFSVRSDSVVIDVIFTFPACDSIHLRRSEDKPRCVAFRSRRIFDSESLNHPTLFAWCYKCAPAVCFPHTIIERPNAERYGYEVMRYCFFNLFVSNLPFYTAGFV